MNRPKPISAVAFFYRHAGYSYPSAATPAQQRAHRLNGVRRLADAEARARDTGCYYQWDIDHECDSSEFSDETPPWRLWYCIMRDADGISIASLHGIDFGRDGGLWDPYRRVVEAELAVEALA